MMSIQYPWLQETWQKLQLSLQQKVLPGALLFSATEGLGEQGIIDQLIKVQLCNNSEVEACGFCHSCSLLQAGTHPDLHRIAPAEGKVSISVDQIREGNRIALESSQLSGQRVIEIAPAEAMTEQAMNALLKTLETPPKSCVFILRSHAPHRLLPTIKSRCQLWHIPTPSLSEYQPWLMENGIEHVPELHYQVCLGAPLKLKEFVEKGLSKQFDDILNALSNFIEQDFALPKPFIDACASDTLIVLHRLSLALIELQKGYFIAVATVDNHSALNRLKSQLTYQQAYDMSRRLAQLVEQLTLHSGLNKELLLSEWLIQAKTL
ncbi:DNA polymerase III subunit delta' [Vibrio sp. UCD-FRSSP16_10]|uniref:DNA polymerase III subunit delta' n=1 Tax=unclassified Vibrio TaxID=2614977 RepID=UPI0007FF1A36|nr:MULTISPECIES: DNA polymerase III subunit delta' [unclassified Vibrio]OBT08512.1 DNA polymerase III subunit delta' [Vibrio sp. UCD-FRSSP16_30]OBT18042.1 DNA polymerase III subunit delta' [Vibrio sp. UCD-FRSSP16_10]